MSPPSERDQGSAAVFRTLESQWRGGGRPHPEHAAGRLFVAHLSQNVKSFTVKLLGRYQVALIERDFCHVMQGMRNSRTISRFGKDSSRFFANSFCLFVLAKI